MRVLDVEDAAFLPSLTLCGNPSSVFTEACSPTSLAQELWGGSRKPKNEKSYTIKLESETLEQNRQVIQKWTLF
jgi:hypothetical protein